MSFIEKLKNRWKKVDSMVCVGLDSDPDLIPECCFGSVGDFNKKIIDATQDLVCAYKFNLAFYSSEPLLDAILYMSIGYIHYYYPEIPVILDGKRADIEHSSKKYARELFDKFKADAITVNPYLGLKGALEPFLERKDKGIIILCRTSNPGAGELQDLEVKTPGIGGKVQTLPLYQYLARRVATQWNKNGNCLLVVGATYPQQLAKVRQIVGKMPILVPGIGKQVGDLEKVIKYGLDSEGYGLIINASRSIIYASKEKDFAQAAARETQRLRDQIREIKQKLGR